MNVNTHSTVADTTSRRDSLRVAGGVGLAAALSSVFGATAEGKSGKHGKRKCKNPCQAQVSQCTLVANLACNDGPDPEGCKEKFLPCCDFLATCRAGEMLQCIIT